MKNILVLIHDDEGQEARLQVALDVTRAVSGHLIGLDIYTIPTAYLGLYGYPGEDLAVAEISAQEDKFLTDMRERLAKEDVSWSLRSAYGDINGALAEAADLADLVVVSSRSASGANKETHVRVGSLPLEAKRPLLAVPPECRRIELLDSALVAWDGSDQASQAMRQAVPLLRLANRVSLCLVGKDAVDNRIDDAAAYLSRHGIHAKEIERLTHDSVAQTLREVAREEGAGYIVMGSYGMGNALEALFGGVTRTMLLQSDLPLFIGH